MNELQVEKTYWASVSGEKIALKCYILFQKIREYEAKYKRPWTNDMQYIDNVLEHVYKKWIPLLHERLKGEQNNDIL